MWSQPHVTHNYYVHMLQATIENTVYVKSNLFLGMLKSPQAVFWSKCLEDVYSSQAVQDFGSMCQERDSEEVKGVLPYWPRIYCKISVVSWSFTTHS